MTDLISFLTSKEIIMVYIVAAIACVLYFIIHLVDKYYYKRKQRQNTKELNRLVEDINYELAKERENAVIEASSTDAIDDEVVYVEPVALKTEDVKLEPINIENNDEELVETIEENKTEKIEVEELAPINGMTEPVVKEEAVKVLEPIEEKLDYTTIEPNKTEAQEELRKLTEMLENAEESNNNIDLTSYEKMQEEEAIISLDELLEKGRKMYENNEFAKWGDDGNEPISLEDLEKTVKMALNKEEDSETSSVVEEVEMVNSTPEIINSNTPDKFVMDDFYTIKTKEEPKNIYSEYKSTPVISPIYGIQKTPIEKDIELENTANYEKLDQEIKKTNEFLMTLKDLQKNLD